MRIGIDLDNTITATSKSKKFFSMLSSFFSKCGTIYIITHRSNDKQSILETKKELEELDITYDHLIITGEKDKFIVNEGIEVYFDDTDEYFLDLPPEVLVFKIREEGNFDFFERKWVYGDETGLKI